MWEYRVDNAVYRWIPGKGGKGTFYAYFNGVLDTERSCKSLDDASEILKKWNVKDVMWEVVDVRKEL